MRVVIRRSILTLFAICAIHNAQPATASDFDDDPTPTSRRHGFVIGFALGPGYSRISQGVSPGFTDVGYRHFDGDDGKFALNSDFKIGLATDEQTLLYWNTKVSWFRQEVSTIGIDGPAGEFHSSSNDVTFASALSGIGLSYYFRDTMPSGFVSLTMGFASLTTPFTGDDRGAGGYGAAFGLGYEFAPHLTLEGTLSYCHTSDNPVKTDFFSLKAVFGLLSF